MATPTLMEFTAALLTIERYLKAKGEELKAKYPDQALAIDAVLTRLDLVDRTLATLTVVYQELEVIATGSGPVVHKPEDLA